MYNCLILLLLPFPLLKFIAVEKYYWSCLYLSLNFVLKIHGFSRFQHLRRKFSLNFERLSIRFELCILPFSFSSSALSLSELSVIVEPRYTDSDSNSFADKWSMLTLFMINVCQNITVIARVQSKRGRQNITLKSIIIDIHLSKPNLIFQRPRWFFIVQFHVHPTMVWHHGGYSSWRH